MKLKPLALGLPLLVGLTVAVSACGDRETEIETPAGETEIEQPADAPVESPTPTTSPTTP